VDARKGIVTQTRRHLRIAALLGIRAAVLVVNKMDLISYEEHRFREIEGDFLNIAGALEMTETQAIPISALEGLNVVKRSAETQWYRGPSLLEHLEATPIRTEAPPMFAMPVQWVNRGAGDFRGFSGTITSGRGSPGDRVTVLPGRGTAEIERIVGFDGNLPSAAAGESVTLTLTKPLDCARGDVIATAEHALEVADQLEATIIWMDEEPLLPGRAYQLKLGTKTVGVSVTSIKYLTDIDSGNRLAAKTIEMNQIAVATLALDQPVVFTPYRQSKGLGSFILIDRMTNSTAGAGLVRFALRRSSNLTWQQLSVDRTAHALIKGQRPRVVWFTGLSGAGKSTIANLLEQKLHNLGRHTFLLDGDNLRQGLSRDLGFSDADRVENIRRAGEVAKLMADAGLIVLCAFISPFRAERRLVRSMMAEDEFIEVFVDVPLDEAERRDPKGLYRKARRGEILNFTGIGSAYEAPETTEIRIDTTLLSAEEAADLVLREIVGS
jgi:bifunctional enzyme CysN/CysC